MTHLPARIRLRLALYLRGRRLHTPASLDAAARAYAAATGRQA